MPNYEIKPFKADLIHRAIDKFNINTIADIGSCWGVHGGYIFDAINYDHNIKGIIVDGKITDNTKSTAQKYNNIILIEGGLGEDNIINKIGKVDATIMFDILLHQANPDWNIFLKKYLSISRIIIIYNQFIENASNSIRYIENGLNWYLENVPHHGEQKVREWFHQHELYNSEQKCLVKNIHNFWQWGITIPDFIELIYKNDFKIDYLCNYGPWNADYQHIINYGIIITK